MYSPVQSFYKPDGLLGKGSTSTVYSVKCLSNHLTSLASKCIRKGDFKQAEENGFVFQKHPAIIRLHEIYEGENNFYMLLDRLDGQGLNVMIAQHQKAQTIFERSEIKVIIQQILEGVKYLQEQKLIHRDLKPENIMFQNYGDLNSLKIVDLGLATRSNAQEYIYPKCGTPGYAAPEIMNWEEGNPLYGHQCDLFSIGVIFYKLKTLKDLFPGNSMGEVLKQNRLCKINLSNLALYEVSLAGQDLMRRLLDPNPNTRITVDQALVHDYFLNDVQVQSEQKKREFQNQKQKLLDDLKPLSLTANLTPNFMITPQQEKVVLQDFFTNPLQHPTFNRQIQFSSLEKSLIPDKLNNLFQNNVKQMISKQQQIKRYQTQEWQDIGLVKKTSFNSPSLVKDSDSRLSNFDPSSNCFILQQQLKMLIISQITSSPTQQQKTEITVLGK